MFKTVPLNDEGYDSRMAFARQLMSTTLQFEVISIATLAYEKGCDFPYNNFVFIVTVNPESIDGARIPVQPGTQPVPAETDQLVLRLPNQAKEYNREMRVENEVAALELARMALSGTCPVPKVFAWSNGAEGVQGWTLQELMPGQEICYDWENLDTASKRILLRQMAAALLCLQRFDLPPSITCFGGLAFREGQNISSAMGTMESGPFQTYPELVAARIHHAALEADHHHRIKGWRDTDLRARLDAFTDNEVAKLLADVPGERKVLAHGDFSTGNFLYDPATLRITACFDFDAAYVGTVADDFLAGVGELPDPDEGQVEAELSKMILHGSPTELQMSHAGERTATSKIWNDVLQELGVIKPSNIQGIAKLANLNWLAKRVVVLPQLRYEHKCPSEEARDRWRSIGERMLSDYLHGHGY